MSANVPSMASPDKSPRLPKIANSLLIVGIGVALALVSLKLISAPARAPLADITPASGNRANSPGPTQLALQIASVHLFGDATKMPTRDVPKPQEPIKDTSLNLKLAGVFAFEPQEQAIAIISAGSAEQNAYGVGDKISGETTLEAVYTDHVVLRNRGKLEKLALPEDVQPIAMRPIESASTTQEQSQQGGQEQSVELPTNPRELRDTLARNPSMLGRVVAAEPYQENGKLVGYRITPKQNPEILEAQGIVAGDIITRVNNIQLNSQKQGIRALRNAVKAENLEVVILRDGIEVPISISLAQ